MHGSKKIRDITIGDIVYVLRQIAAFLLIILAGYFALGILACIGLIALELTTHKMSIEIAEDTEDFSPWIIYVSLTVMAIFTAGLAIVSFFSHKYLRNLNRRQKAESNA